MNKLIPIIGLLVSIPTLMVAIHGRPMPAPQAANGSAGKPGDINGPVTAPEVTTAAKPLSAETKAKLFEAQHGMDKLQLQYAALQTQMTQLQQAFTKQNADFQALQDAAFKEAGVDRTAFTLNTDTMEFAPIPQRHVAPALSGSGTPPTPATK